MNRAIEAWRAAVKLEPETSADLERDIGYLGAALGERYELTGSLIDLNESIQLAERALTLVAANSPDAALHLTNLGNGLRNRFHASGDVASLQRSILCFEKALSITRSADNFNNLGNGLVDRFKVLHNPHDLDSAIKHFEQAVAVTPQDSPDRATHIGNAANGLADRHAQGGNPKELDRAIEYWRQALKLTPASHLMERAERLNNLGTGLDQRYHAFQNGADLDEAIQCFQEAIKLTPDTFPKRPGHFSNLGNALKARYSAGVSSDFPDAIGAYRQACVLGLSANAGSALIASRAWGEWAFNRGEWLEAAEPFRYATQPTKDKRGNLFVSAHVLNQHLGISAFHIRCETLRDYFYATNPQARMEPTAHIL